MLPCASPPNFLIGMGLWLWLAVIGFLQGWETVLSYWKCWPNCVRTMRRYQTMYGSCSSFLYILTRDCALKISMFFKCHNCAITRLWKNVLQQRQSWPGFQRLTSFVRSDFSTWFCTAFLSQKLSTFKTDKCLYSIWYVLSFKYSSTTVQQRLEYLAQLYRMLFGAMRYLYKSWEHRSLNFGTHFKFCAVTPSYNMHQVNPEPCKE